jgi:8-oxo-dGTP pyrophosphatase MutT (NUDIX family)
MRLDLLAVKDALAAIRPRQIPDLSLPQAAVTMPFVESRAGSLLLLTKRTENVRHHKSQISFPGGAQDGAEPLETTALRETEEEIGIAREAMTILGRFNEYLSSSRYRVTPFAAAVTEGFELRPNPLEVASVLQVPVSFFIQNPPDFREIAKSGRHTFVYTYEGEVIWGLTARIVKEFVDLLMTIRPLSKNRTS